MLDIFSLDGMKEKIENALCQLVHSYLNNSTIVKRFPESRAKICEYFLRKGKRIRPLLFTYSYLKYKHIPAENLMLSAASLEIMHIFALIHDDVIDNSDYRRGHSTLHKIFESQFNITQKQSYDLSTVIGDTLYSFAICSFFLVKESPHHKENALSSILSAATKTGEGQFIEMLSSLRPMSSLSLDDIYSIYDCKTSNYTFCGPLIAGALLSGISSTEAQYLYEAGIFLGRAYQTLDDLNEFNEIMDSKCFSSDFIENRRTILLWHIYNSCSEDVRLLIDKNVCEIKCEILFTLFEKFETLQFLKEQINKNIGNAISILEQQSDFNLSFLHSLLKSFFNNYYPSNIKTGNKSKWSF